MRLFCGLFFVVGMIGCGGGASGSADPGSPAPVGSDPGANSPAPGATAAPGPTEASPAPAPAPTKPGGPSADRRIDPIEVGREWTFDVKVLGYYPACANGTYSAKAERAETVDGKSAFYVSSFCPDSPGFDYSVDGDNVSSHYLGEWIDSLEAPVQVGHTWSDGYLTYKWESKGTMSVAAGTFTECWSVTTVASYDSYIVFCRGVGPVHWHFEDGWGNGFDATLTSKNF